MEVQFVCKRAHLASKVLRCLEGKLRGRIASMNGCQHWSVCAITSRTTTPCRVSTSNEHDGGRPACNLIEAGQPACRDSLRDMTFERVEPLTHSGTSALQTLMYRRLTSATMRVIMSNVAGGNHTFHLLNSFEKSLMTTWRCSSQSTPQASSTVVNDIPSKSSEAQILQRYG